MPEAVRFCKLLMVLGQNIISLSLSMSVYPKPNLKFPLTNYFRLCLCLSYSLFVSVSFSHSLFVTFSHSIPIYDQIL